VTKSNAPTPAIAGEEYTWTIDVRNDGDDEAVGPFVVTDTLPAVAPDPLVFVSADGPGWLCTQAAGVVSCVRADSTETLPATAPDNSFEPISITVRIPSDYLTSIDGPLTNTATVTAETYDPDDTNNTSTIGTTVGGEADLEVVKRRGSVDFVAGRPLTYFLAVTNNGPSTSRSTITVTDTLPPQVRFVSAPSAPTTAADPWDCVHAPAGAPSGGTVTCTLAGTPGGALLANEVAPQIPIVVDVLPSADPTVRDRQPS
jgi:large repetitive protein